MEESLKARLIGAVVLVALAVLLIPELLSGRKTAEPVAEEGAGPRGTRSFTIELGPAPGQAARGPTSSTATAPPGGAESGAVPVPATVDVGAEQPAEPVAEPADSSKREAAAAPAPARVAQAPPAIPPPGDAQPAAPARAEPKPPPAPSASAGGWAVQVGAFGSADTARKLSQDLSSAGYRAFVSPVNRGGRTLYRVRVGPVGDRAGAEQLVPRLKARGLPVTVVRND